jgi:hypothetical protein
MKSLLIAALFLSALALSVVANPSKVLAAPYNAADNNPQVVAFYPTGPHGIPSEPGGNHEGMDLVMQAGKSGNFQQWFYGTFPAGGEGLHGDHDVWLVSKDGTCPPNATLVPQAYPGWGDYLVPGADYCVMNNDFHTSK